MVRLVNGTDPGKFRHTIVCLKQSSELEKALNADTGVIVLGAPGFNPAVFYRLTSLLRRLRPAIVHTRNLGCLEGQLCAALAGVPVRIHGEHGRDVLDPEGTSRKYNMLRRALRPLTHHFTAVSDDLAGWLVSRIGVPPRKVTRIHNGVDIEKFQPRPFALCPGMPDSWADPGSFRVGTVGRMFDIKNPGLLAQACAILVQRNPAIRRGLKVAFVGDGPLKPELGRIIAEAGLAEATWFPGSRQDVSGILNALDLFVSPSNAEGISNAILEAMASGVAVLATRVGGNAELVREGETGTLVSPKDANALAAAIQSYLDSPGKLRAHGLAGRRRTEAEFSIRNMVSGYIGVYENQLAGIRRRASV